MADICTGCYNNKLSPMDEDWCEECMRELDPSLCSECKVNKKEYNELLDHDYYCKNCAGKFLHESCHKDQIYWTSCEKCKDKYERHMIDKYKCKNCKTRDKNDDNYKEFCQECIKDNSRACNGCDKDYVDIRSKYDPCTRYTSHHFQFLRSGNNYFDGLCPPCSKIHLHLKLHYGRRKCSTYGCSTEFSTLFRKSNSYLCMDCEIKIGNENRYKKSEVIEDNVHKYALEIKYECESYIKPDENQSRFSPVSEVGTKKETLTYYFIVPETIKTGLDITPRGKFISDENLKLFKLTNPNVLKHKTFKMKKAKIVKTKDLIDI